MKIKAGCGEDCAVVDNVIMGATDGENALLGKCFLSFFYSVRIICSFENKLVCDLI